MTMTRLLHIARHRVRALFAPATVDDELARELAFHFEHLVEEQVAAGLRPEAARQAARRSLGSAAAIEDACRDHRRITWLHDLGRDAAYAVRMLRRSPGFALVAIGSLGISIGAATAVAGVALTVFARDIPMPSGDRIVVAQNAPDAEFRAWIGGLDALEATGASLPDERDLSLAAGQPPVARIAGAAATPGLFATLQVAPQIGRVFSDEDPRQVIVISDALWRSTFKADPHVVGRTVRLGRVDVAVIGVMPPGFGISVARVQYWVPMSFREAGRPIGAFYTLVGRLRPGARDADVRAALKGNTRVMPLRQAWFGWMTGSLATLAAAVSLGWLIACMNVSGLLMARAAARAPEFQLRLALGARQGRIVRQTMAEALVLALAGGVLAALIAWSALAAFATMRPPLGLSRAIDVPMDGALAAGIAVLALVSAALCSAAPAVAAIHLRTPRRRAPVILLAAQVAVALVLLVGTGLYSHSFVRLFGRTINFNPDQLLSFEFRIPVSEFAQRLGTEDGEAQFAMRPPPASRLGRVEDALRRIPGVESAGGITAPPVNSLVVPSATVIVGGHEHRRTPYFLVTPSFFQTIGVQTTGGRTVGVTDTAAAPWVAVVNESAARLFWPHQNPVGQRLMVDALDEQPREVIGVVRDIPARSGRPGFDPIVYTSYLQQPTRYRAPYGNQHGRMTFLLRTAGDPWAFVEPAREAVAAAEPMIPIANMATMRAYLRNRIVEQGSFVGVIAVFASMATLLAALGIYGVVAHKVARQTREIAIRMALGAPATDIVRVVAHPVLVAIGAGLALGLAVSVLAARLIATQLWDVPPTDIATFSMVSMLLAGVGVLACAAPVRRVLRTWNFRISL